MLVQQFEYQFEVFFPIDPSRNYHSFVDHDDEEEEEETEKIDHQTLI